MHPDGGGSSGGHSSFGAHALSHHHHSARASSFSGPSSSLFPLFSSSSRSSTTPSSKAASNSKMASRKSNAVLASTDNPTERQLNDHVVDMPSTHSVLKLAQLILAIVGLTILVLLHHSLRVCLGLDTDRILAFPIFTAVFTILFLFIYNVGRHIVPRFLYHARVFQAFEILALLFWLANVMAILIVLLFEFSLWKYIKMSHDREDHHHIGRRDIFGLGTTALGSLIVWILVSVLELIMFVITLGVFTSRIRRHRQAGLPWTSSRGGDVPIAVAEAVPVAQSTILSAPQMVQNPAAQRGSSPVRVEEVPVTRTEVSRV